jgi:hypothetical protein
MALIGSIAGQVTLSRLHDRQLSGLRQRSGGQVPETRR